MDDTIRLNLAGCDGTFVHDALTGFLEQAAVHGRARVGGHSAAALAEPAGRGPSSQRSVVRRHALRAGSSR